MNIFILICLLCSISFQHIYGESCFFPEVLNGQWFSREAGISKHTTYKWGDVPGYSKCLKSEKHPQKSEYSYVLQKDLNDCYFCLRFIVRTPSVVEKLETSCVLLSKGMEPTVKNVCIDNTTAAEQQWITLFKEDYLSVSCHTSLAGSWQFTYENRQEFAGICNQTDTLIRSCQAPGTAMMKQSQKFSLTYRKCEGVVGTFNGNVEYACLGDWFNGDGHYFAVANTRESRYEEKYRCFLKHRNDSLSLGVSTTAECAFKTVGDAPERLQLTPVQSEHIEPGCNFPADFVGEWLDPENMYTADIVISETHINITDTKRQRRTTYVCLERQDSKIMMARLAVEGCDKDYVCFDFVRDQTNIISYRKGPAILSSNFSVVCADHQFQEPKLNYYYAKNPLPVRCPFVGEFQFSQRGEYPFNTKKNNDIRRYLPLIICKQNISTLSICNTNQTEMLLEIDHCLTVDHLGRPVDLSSSPDYKLSCIGYWQEQQKLYLLTYNELDEFSKYHCWVYQRVGENRVLLSQSFGAICHSAQIATSSGYREGASVAIDATVNDSKYVQVLSMSFTYNAGDEVEDQHKYNFVTNILNKSKQYINNTFDKFKSSGV